MGCQMAFHSKAFERSSVVEEKVRDKLSQQLKSVTEQLVIQRNRELIDEFIEELRRQTANAFERGR